MCIFQFQPVGMISALSRAYAALSCLEPLLLKKDTVIEMVNNSEASCLIKLLRAGLGTPRFLLTSLVCSIDSTPHSIGDCPVIAVISRCFNYIAEVEPEKIMIIILKALSDGIDDVKINLDTYWSKYGNEAAKIISNDLHEEGQFDENDQNLVKEDFRLCRLLDTISRKPLQELCPEDLSDDLTAFSVVLKSIAVVDYLTSSLASVIQPSGGKPLSDACMLVLNKPESILTINRLVEGIYVSSQREMARAKKCFADVPKSEKVRAHPVYKLLVIAVDSILVKESADDVSKRVCKIERGALVDAYERVFSPTNMMRYRVEEGWVSHFRNATSSEPQIQVVDVMRKTKEMLENDQIVASKLGTNMIINKTSDLEKFANISPRRGGFMSLFHLLSSTRYLLSSIVRTFMVAQGPCVGAQFSSKSVVTAHTPHYLSLIHRCMESIVPKIKTLPLSAIRSYDNQIQNQNQNSHSGSSSGSGSNNNSSGSSSSSSGSGNNYESGGWNSRTNNYNSIGGGFGLNSNNQSRSESRRERERENISQQRPRIRFELPLTDQQTHLEEELGPDFFVPGEVPPVSEFGPEKMYLTINSAELFAALLFDDRR